MGIIVFNIVIIFTIKHGVNIRQEKMKTNAKIIPHVVIIGAGFGGLRAARALSDKDVKVTLIDRNNYHLFQPLLYQVATAGLAANEIAYPLRGILRNQKNLTFQMAEVNNIDLAQGKIYSDLGVLNFDYFNNGSG